MVTEGLSHMPGRFALGEEATDKMIVIFIAGAFRGKVGMGDDAIHFEVTGLYTLIDRIRTFFDADSPSMVMGETFTDSCFTFLTRTLDQIMRGDADNALINVIVDCTGGERAMDAVSDKYFAGDVGGVL